MIWVIFYVWHLLQTNWTLSYILGVKIQCFCFNRENAQPIKKLSRFIKWDYILTLSSINRDYFQKCVSGQDRYEWSLTLKDSFILIKLSTKTWIPHIIRASLYPHNFLRLTKFIDFHVCISLIYCLCHYHELSPKLKGSYH
jgi:hypothetical protein